MYFTNQSLQLFSLGIQNEYITGYLHFGILNQVFLKKLPPAAKKMYPMEDSFIARVIELLDTKEFKQPMICWYTDWWAAAWRRWLCLVAVPPRSAAFFPPLTKNIKCIPSRQTKYLIYWYKYFRKSVGE